MQTLDQRYAATAYEKVWTIKEQHKKEEKYKEYGAMAHKLSILIYTAGLAQALMFLDTRGKEAQKPLLDHLAETIGQQDAKTLLKAVREAKLSEYMRLTRQILAALLWYKRFAQSILEVDATEASIESEGER